MGKRGPKPLTDGEKLAEGLGLVPLELGPCPPELGDDGKDCFTRLKPLVEQRRMVGATDRETFIQFCAEWEMFCRLDRACRDAPFCIEGKNGKRKNPIFDLRNTSSRTLLALADKLGLTPACRSRLAVEPSEPNESTEEQEYFA